VVEADLRWLYWAREIQALAQTGLHYAQNPFEAARSRRLLEIAAEIIEAYSEMDGPAVLAAFQAQPGYVTPKVDVRAAVFHQERLLFVKEAMDDGWTFPGGWADVGEAPGLAIEREVAEEAGLQVRATRVIGVYDANRIAEALTLFHAYKILFMCELESGELSTSVETSASAFFAFDDIPAPLSGHRTTARHIDDALAAFHEPGRPVSFD
jgi:ADP-ribose pyrophosphatase YjhB (NUDIX family)